MVICVRIKSSVLYSHKNVSSYSHGNLGALMQIYGCTFTFSRKLAALSYSHINWAIVNWS